MGPLCNLYRIGRDNPANLKRFQEYGPLPGTFEVWGRVVVLGVLKKPNKAPNVFKRDYMEH